MKKLITILTLAGFFTLQGYAAQNSLECKVSAFYYRGNAYSQPVQTADIYHYKINDNAMEEWHNGIKEKEYIPEAKRLGVSGMAYIYQVKEDPMRSEIMLFGETMLRSSKHKFTQRLICKKTT